MSSVTDQALLFANFGAEEGEDDTLPSGRAGRTVLAPLWSFIFDADIALDNDGELPPRPAWFGESQSLAAFEWLRGARGLVPWLSTMRAQKRADELALKLWGPSPKSVWQVSDKAWAHEMTTALGLVPADLQRWFLPIAPGLLQDEPRAKERIEAHIRSLPPCPNGYTLKPRYGSSGRGRVIVRELPLPDAVCASFRRLAARGGAMLEPWLSRTADLSVQMCIGADDVDILATTEQLLRPSGMYEGNRGLLTRDGIRSGTGHDEYLIETGKKIGATLQEAGFRGPCGIDAFTFTHEGTEVLRPFVELNARFTTGTLAAGIIQRAIAAGKIVPGQRWQFGICPPHGGFEKLAGVVDVLPLEIGGAALAVCQGGEPVLTR